MSARITAATAGYVFRTDCAVEGWAYIGQSTRLEPEDVRSYFGSGFNFQQAIADSGTAGLQKTILATASTTLELHYFEMLHIAHARAKGVKLLNGDLGGPRPFPVLQRHLWQQLPEAMASRSNPRRFHKLLKRNRSLVEEAILNASAIPADDFYVGLERDLIALEDLSYACPSCGSAAGAVCRTNARSTARPHNPTRNHQARPRTLD